jgi:GWxTD domain-containing protein
MFAVRLTTLAFLTAMAGPGQLPRQPDADLILRAVRSYRAEQGRTEVNAFVQVPYMLMQPTSATQEGALSYRVEVRVTDSTGLKLLEQSWQNHAAAGLRRPEAFGVDMVRFSLAPGRYRLDVAVVDSVSGRRADAGVELEGFAAAPPASDLMLSPQIRPTDTGDTVPKPAELRWGQMLVTAAARLNVTPLRPDAFYLLEAYSSRPDSGTLQLKVADSAGKALVTTAEQPVQVPAGGGILKGQLDLTGLPPGTYAMVASLELGGKTVERSAAFTMAALNETLEKDVVQREAARVTDEGYFEAMSEEEIAIAKEPISLVAVGGELSKWNKDLSLRAKRRFMTDFWKSRDQTPGTPVNETRQFFYDAVAYADKTYGERGQGRSARPGWKTDRGRIYVKNGSPDETLDRIREGRSVPYQVWRYRRGRDRYYIFADRSNGIGIYQLVHSNDVRETGLPNWREVVREEAVADIGRFLGIDFFDAGSGFR